MIASSLRRGQLEEIGLRGANRDDFVSIPHIYEWVLDYHLRYHELPSEDAIKTMFPDDWNPVEGDFEFWWEQFSDARLARTAQNAIKEAVGRFGQEPSRNVIAKLLSQLAVLNLEGFEAEHLMPTDQGIKQRFEKYQLRKEFDAVSSGKAFGIPSGFKMIQDTHVGYMPGELIGLYARPTVGKTWLLAREAVIAWEAGYRVLYISPENPVNIASIRFDTLMAGRKGMLFSAKGAYVGNPLIEESYRELAQQVGKSDRWMTFDGIEGRPPGLSDIKSLHTRFQPDIIFLDGISLLHNEQKLNAMWEQMHYNAYGLKSFATYAQLPIVMTHQAVNSARGQKATGAGGRGDDWRLPTLNDAAYGDSFVQALSTAITLAPDRRREDVRWYSVRKSRDREVDPRTVGMYWDVDRGVISDLSQMENEQTTLDEAERLSKQRQGSAA